MLGDEEQLRSTDCDFTVQTPRKNSRFGFEMHRAPGITLLQDSPFIE
jgi:hypothetical protein